MKSKTRRRIANSMLVCGAVLVLIGVGYEAAIYPWRILLSQMGVSISETLPEPKPLPQELLLDEAPDASAVDDLTALPENPGLFSSRPAMKLVQLGTIQIPKIGISENVVEGVGNELLYAVGHMRGTAMPGQPGNCVLAAHRDYVLMNPFRHLDKVQPGDRFLISDGETSYIYEVTKNFTVNPTDVWVTEPQEDEDAMATLITCTPVLTSTHRMIVFARLIGPVDKPAATENQLS